MTKLPPDYSDIECEVDKGFDGAPQNSNLQFSGIPAFDSLIQKLSKEIDISNIEFQNDKMAGNVQRTLLANLLPLVPVAVDAYKKKPSMGQATALTNLIKQAIDLFEQIRSVQNLTGQVDYISEEIINPLIKVFINIIYDQIFFVKKNLQQSKDFMGKQKEIDVVFKLLDDMLREVGKKLSEEEEKSVEKVKQYFLEV
jgi:hypothetical protein